MVQSKLWQSYKIGILFFEAFGGERQSCLPLGWSEGETRLCVKTFVKQTAKQGLNLSVKWRLAFHLSHRVVAKIQNVGRNLIRWSEAAPRDQTHRCNLCSEGASENKLTKLQRVA